MASSLQALSAVQRRRRRQQLLSAFGDLTAAGALALGFGFALAFAEEVDAFAFVAWASNQAAVMHEDKFRRTLGGITSRG